MVKVPSLPEKPVSVLLDPVAQDQAVLGQLVGDGQHGGLDRARRRGQEPHDGQQQQRGVQVVGLVVLAEHAPFRHVLGQHVGLDLVGASPPPFGALARRRVRRPGRRRARPRTQHITLDAVKCLGSPRTSQIPWSGSRQCSRAASTNPASPSHTGATIWSAPRWNWTSRASRIIPTRRAAAGSRRRCRPGPGAPLVPGQVVQGLVRSGRVPRRCRT